MLFFRSWTSTSTTCVSLTWCSTFTRSTPSSTRCSWPENSEKRVKQKFSSSFSCWTHSNNRLSENRINILLRSMKITIKHCLFCEFCEKMFLILFSTKKCYKNRLVKHATYCWIIIGYVFFSFKALSQIPNLSFFFFFS